MGLQSAHHSFQGPGSTLSPPHMPDKARLVSLQLVQTPIDNLRTCRERLIASLRVIIICGCTRLEKACPRLPACSRKEGAENERHQTSGIS